MQTLKENVRAAASLGAQSEFLLPHLELHSNRRAVVDGCRGILAYDETTVRLNCGSHIVTLQGGDLCLEHLNGEQVSVCGTLISLEFVSL